MRETPPWAPCRKLHSVTRPVLGLRWCIHWASGADVATDNPDRPSHNTVAKRALHCQRLHAIHPPGTRKARMVSAWVARRRAVHGHVVWTCGALPSRGNCARAGTDTSTRRVPLARSRRVDADRKIWLPSFRRSVLCRTGLAECACAESERARLSWLSASCHRPRSLRWWQATP